MDRKLTRRSLLAGSAAVGLGAVIQPGHAQPTIDAIGDRDGVAIAEAIRTGQVSAPDIIDAAVARAEFAQPKINFLATDTFLDARKQAKQSLYGPLAGVPTLIKDLSDVAGVRTTYGSRAYLNNYPTTHTPLVDAIIASGAMSLGKSATPEFGLTPTTEPLSNGPTRNPWYPKLSAGGSSGGSAAAVAAGVVPMAHGSDGGGSIRIPASCCGVFGFKPSQFRLIGSPLAPSPFTTFTVEGCITRTVRDAAAWLNAYERTGSRKYFSRTGLVTGPSPRRLRIGVQVQDYFGRMPHNEVVRVMSEVTNLCNNLGHKTKSINVGINANAFEAAFGAVWTFFALSGRNNAQARLPAGALLEDYLEPLTLWLAANSPGVNAISPAYSTLGNAAAVYDASFSDIDVLLTPVLSRPPAAIGEFAPTDVAAFQHVNEYAAYTQIQNVAFAPAISVPLGWIQRPDPIPIGVQFSTRKGEERTLLELAFELEQARPWANRHPLIWAGPP